MKYPKGFSKWNASEQESWLVMKLQELIDAEFEIRTNLGKIRGGEMVEFREIDRPDLYEMKDED
jgi:hypothetical protein